MKVINVDATVENWESVLTVLDEELDMLECPMKEHVRIAIAVEEMYVNVAHYAYGDGVGKVKIKISEELNPKKICVEISDFGIPFDPLEHIDPDVTMSAEDRQIGGLGIYMVKQSMDEVSYRYCDNQNVLTMRKIIE